MTHSTNWRRREIEEALNRLPIKAESLFDARYVVDHLALMGSILEQQGRSGFAPRNLQSANESTVRAELTELETRFRNLAAKIKSGGRRNRASEQLAKLIRSAHGPTVEALGDVPAIQLRGEFVLADIVYFRTFLPEKLGNVSYIQSDECLYWSEIARIAQKMELKTISTGRIPDRRAQIVAGICADAYRNLTGAEPTFSVVSGKEDEGKVYGAFLDFVTEVFVILGIERSPLSYASAAAYELRGIGRKK